MPLEGSALQLLCPNSLLTLIADTYDASPNPGGMCPLTRGVIHHSIVLDTLHREPVIMRDRQDAYARGQHYSSMYKHNQLREITPREPTAISAALPPDTIFLCVSSCFFLSVEKVAV